jgi:predicted Zn-ribbon and HTH transcriptional regulator
MSAINRRLVAIAGMLREVRIPDWPNAKRYETLVPGWFCYVCGYQWAQNQRGVKQPRYCPRCKSRRWQG